MGLASDLKAKAADLKQLFPDGWDDVGSFVGQGIAMLEQAARVVEAAEKVGEAAVDYWRAKLAEAEARIRELEGLLESCHNTREFQADKLCNAEARIRELEQGDYMTDHFVHKERARCARIAREWSVTQGTLAEGASEPAFSSYTHAEALLMRVAEAIEEPDDVHLCSICRRRHGPEVTHACE